MDHPYQFDLLKYDFSRNYQTKLGTNEISFSTLLAEMPNSSRLKNINSIDLVATTRVDGRHYKKELTISNPSAIQTLRNLGAGINMLASSTPQLMPRPEATARWVGGDLTAGETARLNITVKNSGKGELYRFIASTDSRVTTFR